MPTLTQKVEVSIDFQLFCSACGAGLCNSAETSSRDRKPVIFFTVDPCKECIKEAKKTAREDFCIKPMTIMGSGLKMQSTTLK